MAQCKSIRRKLTKQGLVITLIQHEVQIAYSRTHIVVTSFSTRKEAIKEFNKYRQSHKKDLV